MEISKNCAPHSPNNQIIKLLSEWLSFRKNILDNKDFPEPPTEGWILPENWYSRINDILRTLIVVKYLDGVEFIIEKIKSLCEQIEKDFNYTFEAREVGYYAVHLYTREEFEIPRMDWDTVKVSTSIEIQITTQLQEVIRKLLHKYYEEPSEAIEKAIVCWSHTLILLCIMIDDIIVGILYDDWFRESRPCIDRSKRMLKCLLGCFRMIRYTPIFFPIQLKEKTSYTFFLIVCFDIASCMDKVYETSPNLIWVASWVPSEKADFILWRMGICVTSSIQLCMRQLFPRGVYHEPRRYT